MTSTTTTIIIQTSVTCRRSKEAILSEEALLAEETEAQWQCKHQQQQ